MLGNLCTIADGQLMTFIIGRFQGMAAVGLYQVGHQIAALPISEIAAPIRPPLFAGFSRVWEDVAELRRQYMNGLELQWVLLVPLSIGLALTSREVTLLFLGGETWGSLARLMPLIAVFSLFDNFGPYVQMIFIVTNRQRAMVAAYFALILFRLLVTGYAAATHGVEGAAWALLGTAILNSSIWQVMVGPLLALRLPSVLAALWRGTAAAMLMAGVVLLVPEDLGAWAGGGTLAVTLVLLAKSAVGAVTYIGAVVALWMVAGSPQHAAEAHLLRAGTAALERALAMLAPRRRAL
jgi:O-antigen/teichoic acid export membrane protein